MHTLIDKPFLLKKSVSVAKHGTFPTTRRPHFFLDEQEVAEMLCRLFFGRTLSPHEFAALCGGSVDELDITVGVCKTGVYLEFRHIPLDCIGACRIYRANNSRLAMANENIRFLSTKDIEGKKRQWFSQQRAACRSLGFETILMNAARSSISQGYLYYPLFGFDAVLPKTVRKSLPKKLAACHTLSELYSSPQGRQFWFECGNSCQMTLKLLKNDHNSMR